MLDDRFRLLAGGSGSALPRHQTLRALIDWSYDLLSPAEQRLLRRLSVFAGSWPLAAVQRVCGEPLPVPPDVSPASFDTFPGASFDLLAELVGKSLAVAEERPGEARYRLLETVRAYARERLRADGEEAAVQYRHADWFLSLAAQAQAHLAGPEQIQWLDRLEAEHDNLRAALEWCAGASARIGDALRLIGYLKRFWLTRGYLSEGRARAEAALGHPAGQDATPARAAALDAAASLAFYQSDYAHARARWEQALAIQRQQNDDRGVAASLSNLGRVAQDQGEYERARDLYAQSLVLKRALDDRQGIAVTLNNLCWIAIYQTDLPTARAMGAQSLALYEALGNPQGVADVLYSLGQVAVQRGEWDEAETLHARNLALRQAAGDRRGMAAALNSLGIIAQAAAHYDRARELWEQSLALKRELGDRQGIGNSLHNLGNIAYFRADYAQARSLYEQSLAIREELGNRRGVASLLQNLGQVAHDAGEPDRALALYRRGIQEHWGLRDRAGVLSLLTGFANLAQEQGQTRRAGCLYGAHDALRLLLQTPLPPTEQEVYEAARAQTQAALAPCDFHAAYAQGEAMTPEQIVACALSVEGGEAAALPRREEPDIAVKG